MIRARAILVSIFIVAGFLFITARLFTIQVIEHDKYKFIADRQQNKSYTVKAKRGIITDRMGDVLAYTEDNISYYVYTKVANAKSIKKISNKFAEVFGKPAEFYKELIETGRGNICIEKKVSKAEALKLDGFVAQGLSAQSDFSRKYPYGSLAAHAIGYVNYENNGANGIEKFYDENLEGSDGSKYIEQDALGKTISIDEDQTRPAQNGNNITLTINRVYQNVLEEKLAEGLERFGSDSAVAIIQDPRTGEILAMASFPNYDPNNYNLFPDAARRNRSITDTYEPGSTMKAITFSILLQENLMNLNQEVNTENGKFKFHGITIRDSHPERRMTARQVLEYSSNIGVTKLTEALDANTLYKYLRDFGFSNPTSIDLPGEAKGFLKKPSEFSGVSKPFISFGYEISVTPLQMITAFSAVINGGILYEPFILSEITNGEGKTIRKNSAKRIRRVLSEETSKQMRDLLVGVVENGTGAEAKLEDVLVGGKTGTSQKLIGSSYSKRKYNSSFIGFLPADNPKITCLVLVDSPRKGKYGGEVAAPIFHDIAAELVNLDLDLIPEESRINRSKNYIDKFLSGLSKSDIGNSSLANPPEIQKPQAEKVKLKSTKVMPNLKNLSVREAISWLSMLKVDFKVIGGGTVYSQSIKAGTKIKEGAICIIKGKKKELKNLRIH